MNRLYKKIAFYFNWKSFMKDISKSLMAYPVIVHFTFKREEIRTKYLDGNLTLHLVFVEELDKYIKIVERKAYKVRRRQALTSEQRIAIYNRAEDRHDYYEHKEFIRKADALLEDNGPT